MSQRLTDMSITRVSLVDKGANTKRIAVLKRDEEASMSEQVAAAIAKVEGDEQARAGIAGWLRKAADALLGRPERVAKVATFGELVAGQELRDALYDSWYTLEDALWGAIYAYDEAGQALSLDAKQTLVAQSLDEFKAYLLAQMATGIQKREGGESARAQAAVAALVAKFGRKISASRMERLTAAAEGLNSVIAEVADTQEETEAAATAEEDTVDKAEIEAIVKTAVTEALKEQAKPPETPEAGAADAAGAEAELTLEGVAEAVVELQKSVDAIAKAPGQRTSADGQEGAEPVKKSKWAGIF